VKNGHNTKIEVMSCFFVFLLELVLTLWYCQVSKFTLFSRQSD